MRYRIWNLVMAVGFAGAAIALSSCSKTRAPSAPVGQPATQPSELQAHSPATMPLATRPQPTTGPSAQSPSDREPSKDLADLVRLWRKLDPGLPEAPESSEQTAARYVATKELQKDPARYFAQKLGVYDNFVAALDIIDRLADSGELSPVEAQALRTELAILQLDQGFRGRVDGPERRATETDGQYRLRFLEWEAGQEGVLRYSRRNRQERLENRLDALEAMAKSGRVRPEVWEILRGPVWLDVEGLVRIEEDTRKGHSYQNLYREVNTLLKKIEEETRISGAPLRPPPPLAVTHPAQGNCDELTDALWNLWNSYRVVKPRSRDSDSEFDDIASTKLEIRQAIDTLDQIEGTRRLGADEMEVLRLTTLHCLGRQGDGTVADWPPILERLAKARSVDPRVCDMVVRAASVDLCRPHRHGGTEGEDAKIYGLLNEIIGKASVGESPLDKTPQWKQVLFAWRFDAAMEKTLTINDSNPMTLYKLGVQLAVEHWYQQALPAMDALMEQKSLDNVEYVLLRAEAKYRIGRRHYLMDEHGHVTPPQAEPIESTLRRVAINLVAFRRMALLHKVRPVVRDMVIETFQHDCRIISDPGQAAKLTDADRKEAGLVSKEANEILAQIDSEAASQPASATRPAQPVEFDP